jgi:hypothetical protein
MDCGSPLPLQQNWRSKSAKGLAQSRTLPRDSLNPDQFFGYSTFEAAPNKSMRKVVIFGRNPNSRKRFQDSWHP